MLNYQKNYMSLLLCFTISSLLAMDHVIDIPENRRLTSRIMVPQYIERVEEDEFNNSLTRGFAQFNQNNTELDIELLRIDSLSNEIDNAIVNNNRRVDHYFRGFVAGLGGFTIAPFVGLGIYVFANCSSNIVPATFGIISTGSLLAGLYCDVSHTSALNEIHKLRNMKPVLERLRTRFRQYNADLENQNDVAS